MQNRPPARLLDALLAYPGWTAVCGLLLTTGALILGLQVEIHTARSELAGPGEPEQVLLDQVLEDLGGTADLIAVIERRPGAPTGDGPLRAAADHLATELAEVPEVGRVFHRVRPEWILQRVPHLIPPSSLTAGLEAMQGHAAILEEMAGAGNLAGFNRALVQLLRQGRETSRIAAPGENPAAPLALLAAAEARLLADPEALPGLLDGLPFLAAGGTTAGPALISSYLSTRDGSALFLFITPASLDDSQPQLRRLVTAVRQRANAVMELHPGFTAGLTGQPALTVEEMEAVRHDSLRTGGLAAAGVALLTLAVFRWRAHALLVLLALAAGVVWSLGAVRLELGYLNMITSAFISTLVGVGVAYGIHPVSEYEMLGAHTSQPHAALSRALRHTFAAVTVSGATTAAAFFSIMLMEFRGFAELGLVAGVGVLLCLAAALLLLPALLLLSSRLRRGRGTGTAPDPPSSLVDRLWVERGALLACRAPRSVVAAALSITLVLGWAATGLGFSDDILDLLPAGSEAVRLQERLLVESNLAADAGIITAADVDELRLLQGAAAREPAIASVESVLPFLPPADAPGSELLQRLAEQAAGLRRRLPGVSAAFSRPELAGSLETLEGELAAAAESAFGAGLGPAAGSLESARAAIATALETVRSAPAAADDGWARAQDHLLSWSRDQLQTLEAAARGPAPKLGDLPLELRQRFVTRSGRLAAYLKPAGDIFAPGFRAEFVAACRRVSPTSTGFPLVFHAVAGRITSGFGRAVAVGGGLVLLILLVDMRRPADALLAMTPLAMGAIWMLGFMRLAGLSFNLANLIALPLIIGVGIDNGVHVMHRLRQEGEAGIATVVRHTCRAILIASLTTLIGFGSLALASHRGLASLGLVLLLGVGACLVTSTVVLPNLLLVVGRARR